MENAIRKQNPTGQLQTYVNYSAEQTQILAALAQMGVLRDTEAGKGYLHSMTVALSKENSLPLVLQALEKISRTERLVGETGLPSLGTILRVMREIAEESSPLKHLHDTVRQIAAVWHQPCTYDLLAAWDRVFGNRTDADIDKAFAWVMRNGDLRRMPTTGDFFAVMPLMRVDREGKRPQ